MHTRLSVIIPAADEEAYLERALESCRRQSYPHIETIVAVNGATDRTPAIARAHADKVIMRNARCGAAAARNLGAAGAAGDIFLFLDADSELAPNVAAEVVRQSTPETFGTVLGLPDSDRLRYRLFFALKNTCHRLDLYHGSLGGVLFCHRDIYHRIGGYDPEMIIDEHYDFSRRARRAGAKYLLLTDCSASTSMRRFERDGTAAMLWFWTRIRMRSLLDGHAKITASRYPPIS